MGRSRDESAFRRHAGSADCDRERVTVECFSKPSGADILIAGNFVGNTPSILRVPVGSHRLEIKLGDYRTVSQSLQFVAGTGLRTIRAPLEK